MKFLTFEFTPQQLAGAWRSVTVWLGLFIIAWPQIYGLLAPNAIAIMGADRWKLFCSIMGLLVILVRFRTFGSLADKVVEKSTQTEE
jgi:hypothetical protein